MLRQDNDLSQQLPEPFNFYYCITSIDHLHFGYWPRTNQGISLEDAQKEMFDLLKGFVPQAPCRILDVGCGFGYSSKQLALQGYDVTAIAPSESMISYARKQNGHAMVDYEAVGFLNEAHARFLSKAYDTVIFQESLQYLKPLKDVFSTTIRLLPTGGKLIIGDEVRLGNELQGQTAVHSRASILNELNASGFRIENHLKIGRHVSMTCDHVIERFKQNFNRIVSTVGLHDTADKLHYFLDGWQAQREWYHKQLLGYDVFVARRPD